MRSALLVAALVACSSPPKPQPQLPPTPIDPTPTPPPGPVEPQPETLAKDTPKATVAGNPFIAPAGWKFAVHGEMTLVTAPEGGSTIVFVDVRNAATGDAALATAWKAYKPDAKWPVEVSVDVPAKDGWTDRKQYQYRTSPDEKRAVFALVERANTVWTVMIYDVADAIGEKRGAQVQLIFSRLFPKGYDRETFAGKQAHELDATRIAELTKFVETHAQELGIPGVGLGIYQNKKTVFSGGFGVKELGKPGKPDGKTAFMIASNTKALTTLLLAKLVDDNKLTWDTPVTTLLPTFKLGDDATTKSVLVKHLICACTGMPRQDLEWIFEFKGSTPDSVMKSLGTMQPTSKFGELFQYSNLMAAAAGYVAGHVAFPKLELGAAYDKAMQAQVFDPLGMKSTTFDYARALRGNVAHPHGLTIDGKPALATMDFNYSIISARPAGAAWSTVDDMLKYVAMELAEGTLPDGKKYISKAPLLERRAPQVPIGKDVTYGMGLMVDVTYGTPVVHHGGDLLGFHSDMIWLPEHGVGVVILTNGDAGGTLRGLFRRKLLEVLFDGKPEAEATAVASAKNLYEELAAGRKQLTVPADPGEATKLAPKYKNAALGEIVVKKAGAATVFDFGEWRSEVATRKNPDGTVSFVTIAPGLSGIDFLVGAGPAKTLVTRDAQHEYVFDAK